MRLKELHCICDKSASNGAWPFGNLLTSTRLTSADCVTVVPTPSCPNALEPHDKTRPQSTRGTEEGKKALKHAEIFRLWCAFLEHCCTEFWKNILRQSPHHQHSRKERHQQKTYICGLSLSSKMYASVSEIWFGIMFYSKCCLRRATVFLPVRKRLKSQPQATWTILWPMPEQSWRVKTSALWLSPSWPLWFCPHTNTSPSSVQYKQNPPRKLF